MIRPILIPALLLLASACNRADEPRAPATPVHTDPAQVIRVAAGTPVRLALRSNQSTGYRWVLMDSAGLGPLRSAGTTYEVPRRYRDNDGAGGTETWAFDAPRAGEGTVSLVYMRPWDATTATDTMRFRVVVE